MLKFARLISWIPTEDGNVHDLIPLTPLGGTAPRIDTIGNVTCSEVPDLVIASIAASLGHETECRGHLKTLLQADPPTPGQTCESAGFTCLWTGPEQWMIMALAAPEDDFAKSIKKSLGDSASITEQTGAWACFSLGGRDLDRCLEMLCNVDLRKLIQGRGTRTNIHGLGCFVIRDMAGDTVRLIGPSASAASLHDSILTTLKACS